MKLKIVYLASFSLLFSCSGEQSEKKIMQDCETIILGENQFENHVTIKYNNKGGFICINKGNDFTFCYGNFAKNSNRILFIPRKTYNIYGIKKIKNEDSAKLYLYSSISDKSFPIELSIEGVEIINGINIIPLSIIENPQLKNTSSIYLNAKIVFNNSLLIDSLLVNPNTSSLQVDTDIHYDSILIKKNTQKLTMTFFKGRNELHYLNNEWKIAQQGDNKQER